MLRQQHENHDAMKFENVNFPGAFISIICLIILLHSRRDDNEMEIAPTSPPKLISCQISHQPRKLDGISHFSAVFRVKIPAKNTSKHARILDRNSKL